MDFSRQRTAFGKKLQEHPLHQRTLARLDRELRAGFLFVMNVALLLGIYRVLFIIVFLLCE